MSCFQVAVAINAALDTHFPVGCGVDVIAEPGRYFATTLVTLASCVYAVKQVDAARITASVGAVAANTIVDAMEERKKGYLYYMSDGLFQSYNSIFWHDYAPSAKLLFDDADGAKLDENGNELERFASTL